MGSSKDLSCAAWGYQFVDIEWRKNGEKLLYYDWQLIDTKSGNTYGYTAPNYFERTLKITKMGIDDEGNYSCM